MIENNAPIPNKIIQIMMVKNLLLLQTLIKFMWVIQYKVYPMEMVSNILVFNLYFVCVWEDLIIIYAIMWINQMYRTHK